MAHKVKGCYLKELIKKFIFMAVVVLILIYSDFKQISLNSAFIKAEASKNTVWHKYLQPYNSSVIS